MRRSLYAAALVAVGGLVAACNNDLTVPNFNNPTPGSIAADPSAINFAVRGILVGVRASYGGFISDVGVFGRESYNYFPTDARNVQHYLKQNPLDPAGFASGGWNQHYQTLRNILLLDQAVNASPVFTAAQKDAALGFSHTLSALELYYLVTQRHNFGIVVEIKEDPRAVAPFVSRDSAWNYIAARLDEAATHLTAAGSSAFPFSLTSGFSSNGDFSTPAGFLKFNRALKARVEVTRASLRNPACGANGVTCYQNALTALTGSFLSLNAGDLNLGVYHVFSTDPGDTRNALNQDVTKDLLSHPSNKTDAAPGDLRVNKLRLLVDSKGNPQPRGPSGGSINGIETGYGFQIYPGQTSPAPIIRDEELILIRAEARWFTGDKSGAISDLNFVRQASGGLGPTGLTTGSSDDTFITALLYERRYSLLWEGHRWADVRRFNRINTLPLDLPSHFRQLQQPVPLGECEFRARAATDMPCPTGPTGPTP